MKISAVMICFNAEQTIRNALKSVDWADEIIVVDSYSSDGTVEICKEFNVSFFQRKWQGFGNQRNWAVEQSANDWVFVIDSDEELSPELREEILNIKQNGAIVDVYEMSWKVFYMNRWITHSGWYPNYKARFFDKNKASWDDRILHEELKYEGTSQKLKGDLYHYTYLDFNDHVESLNRYSSLAAEELFSKGKSPRLFKSIFGAIWRFKKAYYFKRGFLDGFAGFTIAVMESYYVMLRYFKHLEMYSKNKKTG